MQQIVVDGVKYQLDSYTDINGKIYDVATVLGLENPNTKTSILIPQVIQRHSVLKVSDKAFQNDESLYFVTFNGDVNIGDYAFANCSNLRYIQMNPIGLKRQIIKVGERAFWKCQAFEEFRTTAIVDIQQQAFWGCVNLAACHGLIRIIEEMAFYQCSKLDNMAFADNTKWKEFAFVDCFNLEHLTFFNKIDEFMDESWLDFIKKKNIKCTRNFQYLDWAYEGADIHVNV